MEMEDNRLDTVRRFQDLVVSAPVHKKREHKLDKHLSSLRVAFMERGLTYQQVQRLLEQSGEDISLTELRRYAISREICPGERKKRVQPAKEIKKSGPLPVDKPSVEAPPVEPSQKRPASRLLTDKDFSVDPAPRPISPPKPDRPPRDMNQFGYFTEEEKKKLALEKTEKEKTESKKEEG